MGAGTEHHVPTTEERLTGIQYLRASYARWPQFSRWLIVSFLIACCMLVGTALAATWAAAPDASAGDYNLLVNSSDRWGDWQYLLIRNHLVLGIHFGACIIGAIIGRRRGYHGNVSSHSFNPDLPKWVSHAALWYAWIVTLSSIVAQTLKSGEIVADVAASLGVPPSLLVCALVPHALIELTAIFLPLGLFIREARVGKLDNMGLWSVQAALVAIPMLVVAATIEVLVSPHVVHWLVQLMG
jgi:hypothetical protein